MTPDPYRSEGKKRMLALSIGAGALVLLLAVVGGVNALGLTGKRSPAVLAQEGAPPPAVLPDVQTSNPVLPDEAKGMPEDVRNWLEHLRRTEDKRRSLSSEQIASLTTAMAKMNSSRITGLIDQILGDGTETPEQPVAEALHLDTQDKRAQWQQLRQEFMQVPPPADCVGIQASYNETLGETSAMIMEVLTALEGASDDPEAAIAALTKMQGTSSERIDVVAKETDSQVQTVCDKYDTRKWFSISSDIGGGIMGKLGLGF